MLRPTLDSRESDTQSPPEPLLSTDDVDESILPVPPRKRGRRRRSRTPRSASSRRQPVVSLSKTQEMGAAAEGWEEISEAEFAGYDASQSAQTYQAGEMSAFARFEAHYLRPFFLRPYTTVELREGQELLERLTRRWYTAAQRLPCTPSAVEMMASTARGVDGGFQSVELECVVEGSGDGHADNNSLQL